MTAQVISMGAHERMTPQEALELCAREFAEWQDVMVIGFDADGDLRVRSSAMSRKDAVFLLLEALDHARGKS